MEHKNISQAVIKRLPRYYRYLGDLLDNGVDRISSGKLSELMNITASQIRQDLNNFGGFGQQGYGYNVSYLYQEIAKILDLEKKHNIIIIGVGNVGRSITNYTDFKKLGFNIVAIFDNNEEIVGTQVNGVTISHFTQLENFIKNNKVDIAAIAVPKQGALEVAKKIIDLGIKAIWNFAPVDLKISSDVVVENVHLTDSLMTLSYNMSKYNK